MGEPVKLILNDITTTTTNKINFKVLSRPTNLEGSQIWNSTIHKPNEHVQDATLKLRWEMKDIEQEYILPVLINEAIWNKNQATLPQSKLIFFT